MGLVQNIKSTLKNVHVNILYIILYYIILYSFKKKNYWSLFFYNLKLICNNDYFDILLCTSSLFINLLIKSQNINVMFSRSYNEYPFFILCFIMWCLNIKHVFQCIWFNLYNFTNSNLFIDSFISQHNYQLIVLARTLIMVQSYFVPYLSTFPKHASTKLHNKKYTPPS